MKIILAFLLTLLFAVTGNASLKDRVQPIVSGDLNIGVDTFIIETHDKYIAAIVRGIDQGTANDLTLSMREILNLHSPDSVVLIEKQIFDKNSKRFSLAERDMVLKSDFTMRLAAEPLIRSDMQEAKPGSLEEIIWDKVAGPDGLGSKILGRHPEPVAMSDKYNKPVDTKRYAQVIQKEIGGIFLDRKSIKKTAEGCSALMVEAFTFDDELNYGGMVTNYTYQPYVDAYYAISTHEYSFAKKAYRQLRLAIFGRDGKVIYAIRNPDARWVDSDPVLPFAFMALRRNLPKDISKPLADDLKSFDAFVQERIAEAAKKPEESQNNETAK